MDGTKTCFLLYKFDIDNEDKFFWNLTNYWPIKLFVGVNQLAMSINAFYNLGEGTLRLITFKFQTFGSLKYLVYN
jgi:hypothetical protein